MNTTIITSYHRIIVVEKEGIRHLGIQLMESRKARELSIFTGLKKEHGWILSGDRLEPWPVTGFLEAQGKVCFYGPYEDGLLLSQLLDHPEAGHLMYLNRLASALTVLQEKHLGLEKLYTNGILFLEDGRILFLPWKIMEELDRIQEQDQHLYCYEQVNHPEMEGEKNMSFSIAVLAYRMITGKFPFAGTTEEEIHGYIRERTILSPKLENPGLLTPVSDIIMTTLGKQEGTPLTLNGWKQKLQEWEQTGITEPVSEESRKHLREEAVLLEARSDKQYKRRRYFFKNKTKLIITAAAIGVALWIGSSILKNILAPPATLGKTPKEVVQMFYESIDSLDTETLEECLDRKVHVAEQQEILNLYVISRVRTAYEGGSGLINAGEWVASGKPPLNPTNFVYGITSLTVTKEQEGVFRAAYEKWTTSREDEADSMEPGIPVVRGTFRKDRLYLENTGKYWIITAIEKLTDREIPD